MKNFIENIDNRVFERDYILDHVLPRLAPYDDRNEAEKNGLWHRLYFGLHMIMEFYVPITPMDCEYVSSYRISVDHIHNLDISGDELFGRSLVNLQKIATVMQMRDILAKFFTDQEVEDTPIPMYIVSNANCLYGAASIFCPDIQDYLVDILGEPFIILPSSVHEVICVPTGVCTDLNEMCGLVQEVNSTMLERREKLSDSVYIYEGGHIGVYDRK